MHTTAEKKSTLCTLYAHLVHRMSILVPWADPKNSAPEGLNSNVFLVINVIDKMSHREVFGPLVLLKTPIISACDFPCPPLDPPMSCDVNVIRSRMLLIAFVVICSVDIC